MFNNSVIFSCFSIYMIFISEIDKFKCHANKILVSIMVINLIRCRENEKPECRNTFYVLGS